MQSNLYPEKGGDEVPRGSGCRASRLGDRLVVLLRGGGERRLRRVALKPVESLQVQGRVLLCSCGCKLVTLKTEWWFSAKDARWHMPSSSCPFSVGAVRRNVLNCVIKMTGKGSFHQRCDSQTRTKAAKCFPPTSSDADGGSAETA